MERWQELAPTAPLALFHSVVAERLRAVPASEPVTAPRQDSLFAVLPMTKEMSLAMPETVHIHPWNNVSQVSPL